MAVEFTLDLDGRTWRGEISLEAVKFLYPNARTPEEAVAASSFVTKRFARRVRAITSADEEPIVLTTRDFQADAPPR